MPELLISARSTIRTAAAAAPTGSPVPLNDTTALVVDLAEDLDMATVDRFRRVYRMLFDQATARGLTAGDLVVLDLSRVGFVSVDGTAALVEAKDLADTRGIDFTLVTCSRGVDHALAATGMLRLFRCYPSVESARACECRAADLRGADLGHPVGP
ncbi:STAS domain-containing protein [Rhodococcus sp. SGAir0479]|uniref:STAS domain-containing protein n=1 Tax=Rhodococcus sp. SGAir0479 TaxID=2567884 RepID=UPI0020C800D3|nr:STAS domain-containing protein [Rhodococcus sp. SGAir0479]